MSITFNPQATGTVIEQDGVAVAYINDNGSLELVNPPVAPTGNMVTSFNQFGNSLSANGYQKLPSGLIIQWGTVSVSSAVTGTTGEGVVTFPVAFPNAALSVTASYELTGGAITGALGLYHRSLSTSGVRFGLDEASATATTTSVKWLAIGY